MPEFSAAVSRERQDVQSMIAWIDEAVAPWQWATLAVTAAMYLSFALLHQSVAPADVAAVMTPIALATAASAAVMGLSLGTMAPWLRARVFFTVAALIWLNSATHLILDPQPHHTTNLAVAILACAIFLIRIEEFTAMVVACVMAFAIAAASAQGGQDWTHFSVHLFECVVVAAILFFIKRGVCLAASNAQFREKALRLAAEANAMRAERSNAAKSMFLANMSHELRTPLNAVIGFSDILRMGTLSPQKTNEYANHVHESGVYLLDLINQVLDLSQDGAPLSETTFDFVGFWDTIVLEGHEAAEARSIRLEALPAPPGVHVTGDPKRIKSAIMQLAGNAVKFTPSLGKVTISAELSADGGLEIAVHDDGIGIAPQDIERVFEPFYQAESDYAKRYQGMGLGLALARQYARAHGGDVQLTSVLGQGATARLRLPPARVKVLENVAPFAAAS